MAMPWLVETPVSKDVGAEIATRPPKSNSRIVLAIVDVPAKRPGSSVLYAGKFFGTGKLLGKVI